MIHFTKIRWKNFISTGNVFTEIKLDKSQSTVIVGENGSGKSTILDALTFVLFNSPFRKIKKTQLANSVNKRDSVVEVEFRIGSRDYLVRRGQHPAIFQIFKDGTLIDQPGAAKDYQRILEEQILRLNYKSFTQVVILGSATFTPFMQLNPRDRREVIEDLLDIQIFSQMNILLKDRISKNKNDRMEVALDIDLVNNKIEVQNKYAEQLRRNFENDIVEYQKLVAGCRHTNEEKLFKISNIERDIERLLSGITDKAKVSDRFKKGGNLVNKLSAKSNRINSRATFFSDNDHCPTCEQNIDIETKSEKIKKALFEYDQLKGAIDQLKEKNDKLSVRLLAIESISSDIENIYIEKSNLEMDVKSSNRTIVQYQKSIDSLENRRNENINAPAIEELGEEIALLKLKHEQIIKDNTVLEFGLDILKDGGIKTNIINQYVPVINKLINKYLSSMDFFVNFELDEEFNETLKSRHRDKFSYASFSEGEKARIDISLMLTWRAIAKIKNSVNTNLLILDEVLDSSLDVNGVEILMALFNELNDTNIFVISHKSDMMGDKFRSMIRFEKIKSFSRIA
jgi:DNA repair exonuclease SbcCD ATPase subunit